ncbi:MoaD/ThiS family protein [Flavobacterium sp. F52]|uniref:MoaD/ThiS family protein n=1 Tax=Flavobacterium sp. F52 TaxID=1202532 RepID=UPI000272DBE5|nr:MoaD/ThiS family protein [Flavobacterium sp. F52]EJG03191.1 sulfur carrier protein ThiS [Flavobacterium sp. F52]
MNILLFGIAKDIAGKSVIQFETENPVHVADLKNRLFHLYPELGNLSSVRIAVNNHYAEEDQILSINDEIALIPPVSGG